MKQTYGTLAALVIATMGSTSWAQHRPLAQLDVELAMDTGLLVNRTSQRGVIYSEQVQVPGAPWVRLNFDQAVLGQPQAKAPGAATVLRLTSLQDGAVQMMNAAHLQQWNYTSAYFNGDTVLIEIIADADAAPSHLSMKQVWAGVLDEEGGVSSICFGTDDRALSSDPAQGRLVPIGCTAWLFNDTNRTFLTAGHCTTSAGSVVEFNVPLSTSSGTIVHPGPEDQYPVDLASVQFQNGGAGNDWKYFGCFPNSTTSLSPYAAQGAFYTLATAPPAIGNPAQPIRITGYGTVSSPVSLTWNQVQKTHVGPYFSFAGTLIRYQTDTTGGNSGSPVVDENALLTIGIHTHAGCNSTGGSNQGTAINHPNLVNALANPLGVCAPQDFTIGTTPASQTLCAPTDAVYTINISAGTNPAPVTLSISGVPGGASANFSVNPATPGGSSTLTISDTASAAPGPYIMQIEASNGSITLFGSATLNLYTAVPNQVTLISPGNGATGVLPAPTFTWNAATQAQSYLLEVATNPAFTPVLYSASVAGTSHTIGSGLAQTTQHWWRVKASNLCGDGEVSAVNTFTTGTVPPILLVDDDDNGPDVRSYYTGALDAIGLVYDVWNTANSDNEPTAAQLAPYDVVIWFTGDEFGGFCGPNAASEAALTSWLNGGGCLFICSQDYRYDRGFTAFMDQQLGVTSIANDVSQTSATGQGSLFTGFGPYALTYPFTNFSDRMVIDGDAEVAFMGSTTGGVQGPAAVNKDGGDWRTTFWAYPIEAIPDPNARRDLMARVLDWCNELNQQPCTGDVQVSYGEVNVDDLLFVIGMWGVTGAPGTVPGDVTGDGIVDIDDLLAVISGWGPCP